MIAPHHGRDSDRSYDFLDTVNPQLTLFGCAPSVDLVNIAHRKGTSIQFPFTGSVIGPFQVLSPTREVYRLFLPQFDRTPEPDESALRAAGAWLGKSPRRTALSAFLEKAAAAVQKFFTESWTSERLKEGGHTSASNDSDTNRLGG